MYRTVQKGDKWIIQHKVLGIWLKVKSPAYFTSLGAAQSYINTVMDYINTVMEK